MRSLFLLTLLGQLAGDPEGPIFTNPAMLRSTSSSTAPFSFCSQLQAGDKAGAWGCWDVSTGAIAASSGSSLTFSGVSSPAVHTGTTCASPAYVSTTSTAWVAAGNSTFPAGDFTVCGLFDLTGVSTPYGVYSMGDMGNGTNLPLYQETNATWVIGGSTGSAATSNPGAALTLSCTTNHAGTINMYFNNGTLSGPWSPFTFATATNEAWRWGTDGITGGYHFVGHYLAGFITEKQLSQADVQRIYGKWVSCS
jgi:hypothetical protein